ncbi:UDP-2,3-diacylglucosamine diphosphatase [Candidatus Parcubacteria bacterium]|nr:MAG: UDP-2,3-diacylglucosamine diphosphatase [Candidatus Parcubacteria bacterium]
MKNIKKKINTLIISDIHLGDSSTRCKEILSLLKKYSFKRLILNGDILDGLNFNRLHTKHWEILSKFRELSAKREVVWVLGNHDAPGHVLFKLLGIKVCHRYSWIYNGKKFLAIHGHQFDKFLSNNYILSQIAFIFYDALKKIDKKRILVDYIKLHNKTWKRGSSEVAKGALRLAKLLKADYVFCGHTHKLLEKKKKG